MIKIGSEIIFYFSLSMIIYVYLGYPVLIALLARIRKRNVVQGAFYPHVTILIAAYNEEKCIEATVRNKLQLDYAETKMEIIVISDGSTDGTDAIVHGFDRKRVKLLRQEPRAGKTSALNLAVREAKGDILIFSDANSIYAPDAVQKLVRNFVDPAVGYVTGRMVYANPDGSAIGDGCSGYMNYENVLRSLETGIGSVVGVDGGIDAVRKELYIPMNPDQLPDFVLPLRVVAQGRRVVYDAGAVLREPALDDAGDEYRMRVRVSLRALWALFEMRQLLRFRGNPLFAWQLWSHKILRYLCFIFLASAWLSNALLWNQGFFYRFIFILQNLTYLAVLTMPMLERCGCGFRLGAYARYFALINLAAAHAFGKFLIGKKQATWTPRKG